MESAGVVLECCLEGVESARQAHRAGAHRIELCANLAQGGVTPSIGDIEGAVAAGAESRTRVHVLIRPRPGNFAYSALEEQVMRKDIAAAVRAGAHGVVIGALLEDGGIDQDMTKGLVQEALSAAAPESCSITFHRAFDCCTAKPLAALETLIRVGVDRVFTSGRAESAWGGRDVIANLVKAAEGRIVVMPGAGVTRHNVQELLLHTGAREVHVGSDCHEIVSETVPQQGAGSSGLSGEGTGGVLKRVTRRRVVEMLETLDQGSQHG